MNTEHQLKSKLVWPVCQKSMKLKQNGTGAITAAKNQRFYWVITWKFLFSGGGWWWGIDFLFGGNKDLVGGEGVLGGNFPRWWGRMYEFLAGGGGLPIPPVAKTLN